MGGVMLIAAKSGNTIAERLEYYSMPEPNTGCTLWFGVSLPAGYGRINLGGQQKLAHRVAYELANGPVPDGLVIDHMCNTPACINPAHMKATTQTKNTLRSEVAPTAINARKTHCDQGHELSGDNLYLSADGAYRICRTCSLEGQRRRYRERVGHVRPYRKSNKAAGIDPEALTSEGIDEQGEGR